MEICPVTPPEVAEMVVDPAESGVTNPVVLTLATAVLLEDQVALWVTSCVPPPVRVAVAVNCSPPFASNTTEPLGEVTAMLVTTLLLTLKVVDALRFPEVAVIVLLPVAVPAVARPELLMLAMLVSEELHVTVEVTSRELPSPNDPMAVNCCVLLGWIVGLLGEIETATSVLPEGKNCPHPASASAALRQRTAR
jgi:hypothetical protein